MKLNPRPPPNLDLIAAHMCPMPPAACPNGAESFLITYEVNKAFLKIKTA